MKTFKLILFFLLVTLGVNAQTVITGGAGIVKTNGDPDLNANLVNQDQRYEASVAWDTVNNVLYTYNVSLAQGVRWNPLTSGDGSITNEGILGVTSGASNTASLQGYNSAGTATGSGVQIAGTAGITITETTSTDGGSITFTATDPSITNETISSATVSAGDLTIVEGATTTVIPVISIAPVQSVVQGSNVTVTNAAGVYTVNATAQVISTTAASANSTTISQTQTGGSITLSATAPLTLTGVADAPVIGLATLVDYDNHVAAGVGGIAIGGMYKASLTNTLGATPGTVLIRE